MLFLNHGEYESENTSVLRRFRRNACAILPPSAVPCRLLGPLLKNATTVKYARLLRVINEARASRARRTMMAPPVHRRLIVVPPRPFESISIGCCGACALFTSR